MIKPTPQMTPEFAMKMRYKAVDAIKSMTPNNPNRRGFIQVLAEDERVKDIAQALEVNSSTVYRAINEPDNFFLDLKSKPYQTRERVS